MLLFIGKDSVKDQILDFTVCILMKYLSGIIEVHLLCYQKVVIDDS